MPPVINMSRQDLLARRARILNRIELDEDAFERAYATRSLSAAEWMAKEELEEIEFLLGSDR